MVQYNTIQMRFYIYFFLSLPPPPPHPVMFPLILSHRSIQLIRKGVKLPSPFAIDLHYQRRGKNKLSFCPIRQQRVVSPLPLVPKCPPETAFKNPGAKILNA